MLCMRHTISHLIDHNLHYTIAIYHSIYNMLCTLGYMISPENRPALLRHLQTKQMGNGCMRVASQRTTSFLRHNQTKQTEEGCVSGVEDGLKPWKPWTYVKMLSKSTPNRKNAILHWPKLD